MTIRDRLITVLVIGIFVRLILMQFFRHPANEEFIFHVALAYIYGVNPLLVAGSWGPTFWLFFFPAYVPFLIFEFFGVHYAFILNNLFRIPLLIGDVLVYYCMYKMSLLLSHKPRMSLIVASAYFLNPYVITLFIYGANDSIMTSFTLLSFLNLLQNKTTKAGVFLALAGFARYLPMLVLPTYIGYMWLKSSDTRWTQIILFLKGFLVTSVLLAIPYLLIIIPLFNSFPNLFWNWVANVFGSGTTTGETRFLPIDFQYNFSGIFAEIGVWPYFSSFTGYRAFFLAYAVITFFMLWRLRPTARCINRHFIAIYSLFLLIIPLYQMLYLVWVLPFLFLEAKLFQSLPRRFPFLLWFTSILIEPIILGNFLQSGMSYFLRQSLPGILPPEEIWVFNNMTLQYSVSLLHGSLILLTLVLVVFPRITSTAQSSTDSMSKILCNYKARIGFRGWIVAFLLFTMFSFDLLRLAYGSILGDYSMIFMSVSVSTGTLVLAILFYEILKNRSLVSDGHEFRLHSTAEKIMTTINLLSLVVVQSLAYAEGIFTFVLVAIVYLGTLWLFKPLSASLCGQRVCFIFIPILLGFISLTLKTQLILIGTLVYMASWFYLQLGLELKSEIVLIHLSEQNRSKNEKLLRFRELRIVSKLFNCSRLVDSKKLARGKSWRTRPTVLVLFLAFLLILSYIPVTIAHLNGRITNPSTTPVWPLRFWTHGSYRTSKGAIEITSKITHLEGQNLGKTYIIGSIDYPASSSVKWAFDYWLVPFMSNQLKNATSASIMVIQKSPPVTTKYGSDINISLNNRTIAHYNLTGVSLKTPHTIGWGWVYIEDMSRGQLFESGVKGIINGVMTYVKNTGSQNAMITIELSEKPEGEILASSNASVPASFEPGWMRVPFNITWPYDSVFVMVRSTPMSKGVFLGEHDADDLGYFSDNGIRWVQHARGYDLGVDTGLYGPSSDFPVQRSTGSSDSQSYQIPIDMNQVEAVNTLNITAGAHVSWEIVSVTFTLESYPEMITVQAWQLSSYLIVLEFGLTLGFLFVGVKRLKRWLGSPTQLKIDEFF